MDSLVTEVSFDTDQRLVYVPGYCLESVDPEFLF